MYKLFEKVPVDILYTKCLEEKSSLFLGIYLRDAEDAAGAAECAAPVMKSRWCCWSGVVAVRELCGAARESVYTKTRRFLCLKYTEVS